MYYCTNILSFNKFFILNIELNIKLLSTCTFANQTFLTELLGPPLVKPVWRDVKTEPLFHRLRGFNFSTAKSVTN